MATELQRANGPARDLAPTPASPIDDFALLDTYAGGVSEEAPRPEWLATISAGELVEKDGKTYPRSSRDGRIFLHDPTGRAPGLRARLEATGFRRLTIAFPWDDPRLFIQQRFERRSATRLEVYGDAERIHVLGKNGRQTYEGGTREYRDTVATCKVSVSVFFTAAGWGADGPEIEFPDGLGATYRLRFTSRNSLRSIVNTLRDVARFTQGRLAGIPFDLQIDYRDVADGSGEKRHIAVWVITMRPPTELRLTSTNFRTVMERALAQGSALMLPPPSAETLELAALEAPSVDMDEPTDAEVGLLQAGGACDASHWKRRWHAIADGSIYDDPFERADFIRERTGGRFQSLAAFLAQATEGEASALIEALQVAVGGSERPRAALTQETFLQRAYLEFRYADKQDIADALGVDFLSDWPLQGRTWDLAYERLRERADARAEGRAVRQEVTGLQEIAPGLAAAAPAAIEATLARPSVAEYEAIFGEPPDDADEGDGDPEPPTLESEAAQTIAGLRQMVRDQPADLSAARATNKQLSVLRGSFADALSIRNGDVERLIRALFEIPAAELSMAHIEVLGSWMRLGLARNQAQAVLACAPNGQRGLIDS